MYYSGLARLNSHPSTINLLKCDFSDRNCPSNILDLDLYLLSYKRFKGVALH